MERNNDNKLTDARDVILAFLRKMDCTFEEIEKVLQMCRSEVDAELKRQKFSEVRKVDFPVGENVRFRTKGARPGGEDNG